jgi:hypothetical protein
MNENLGKERLIHQSLGLCFLAAYTRCGGFEEGLLVQLVRRAGNP